MILVGNNVPLDRFTSFDSPGGQPSETSCGNTLTFVPKDHDWKLFGPRRYQGVEVVVPQSWRDPSSVTSRWSIALGTKNNAIFLHRWGTLWSATNAINALYVRRGKGGIHKAFRKQSLYSSRIH